eukprot:gene22857-63903_t
MSPLSLAPRTTQLELLSLSTPEQPLLPPPAAGGGRAVPPPLPPPPPRTG